MGEIYNNLKTHSQAVLTFQTGAISFPLPRPTLPGALMIMMTAMMTIFLCILMLMIRMIRMISVIMSPVPLPPSRSVVYQTISSAPTNLPTPLLPLEQAKVIMLNPIPPKTSQSILFPFQRFRVSRQHTEGAEELYQHGNYSPISPPIVFPITTSDNQ